MSEQNYFNISSLIQCYLLFFCFFIIHCEIYQEFLCEFFVQCAFILYWPSNSQCKGTEVTLIKHTHSKYSRCSLTSSKGFTVMLWSDSGESFSKSTTRSDEGLLYLSDNRDITDSTTLGVSPMTKLKNLKHHLLVINVTIIAIYPKIIHFKKFSDISISVLFPWKPNLG